MANRIDSIELTQANGTWISLVSVTSAPGNNTSTNGGYLRSELRVGANLDSYAAVRAVRSVSNTGVISRFAAIQAGSGSSDGPDFTFGMDGVGRSPDKWSSDSKTVSAWSGVISTKGAFYGEDLNLSTIATSSWVMPLLTKKTHNNNLAGTTTGVAALWPGSGQYSECYLLSAGDDGGVARLSVQAGRSDVYFYIGSSTYALNKTVVSDRRMKEGIEYGEDAADEALANIDNMKPVNFKFIDDLLHRMRRGLIAQDLQEIDENYVKLMEFMGDDMQMHEQLRLDTNALLLDVLLAVHALSRKMKGQDARLTAIEEMLKDK